MSQVIDHTKDGITHINCWSKSTSDLGKALSNFAHIPFKHPTYGYFSSVEAFWYYIKTGMKHEHLRRLHGAFAKSSGSKLPVVEMDSAEFRRLICEAITCKIEQTPWLLEAVTINQLPYMHYYVYGTGLTAVIRDNPQHYWQQECIAAIGKKWSETTTEK